MTGSDWDPKQYAKFAAMRARPFWDLAALIVPPDSGRIERMVDLGCGPGALTAALVEQLDVASAVGVDASPAMLQDARAHATARLSFVAGDIGAWSDPDGVDLLFANASLQWVPDHPTVLARWIDAIRPGGQLAIQMPANADHPSHACAVSVAAQAPFFAAMNGAPPPDPVAANVLCPEAYAELLWELGIVDPHVRLQVYPQQMPSCRDVVEWVKGTSLTRFFGVLPPEFHQPFVAAYTDALLRAIGDKAPYFYAFKRILIHGRRG